jgi:hypothetical protein
MPRIVRAEVLGFRRSLHAGETARSSRSVVSVLAFIFSAFNGLEIELNAPLSLTAC